MWLCFTGRQWVIDRSKPQRFGIARADPVTFTQSIARRVTIAVAKPDRVFARRGRYLVQSHHHRCSRRLASRI